MQWMIAKKQKTFKGGNNDSIKNNSNKNDLKYDNLQYTKLKKIT